MTIPPVPRKWPAYTTAAIGIVFIIGFAMVGSAWLFRDAREYPVP